MIKFFMFIYISLLFYVLLPSLDCICVYNYICSYSWQMVCNKKLIIPKGWEEDWFSELLCIYYVLHLLAFHFQLDYEAASMHNITGKDEESVFCLWGLPDHIYKETFSLWWTYSFLGQTEAYITDSLLSGSFADWGSSNLYSRDDLGSFILYITLK